MTTPASTTKPPTQVASVQGIASVPITMNEPPAFDWGRLVQLPPFQMFAEETERPDRTRPDYSAEGHAGKFVRARGAGQDLFDQYAAWHAAKGYWPNETPMGEVANA
ncbi:hypothetical protein A4F85_04620 [Delftia sp. GW456-R20]|uniref:hypothetical protein n=1 Tax=Delftia sp. GW456-R20 TaxID=1827145 RepID=UPI0007AEC273|nr:hypothetical protein [Delftia sp. GW456-R20]KZK32005.1 hypothetical protein A4F85_04620 [Delftia sp. GW456-R20]